MKFFHSNYLLYFTAASVFIMLLSLHFGWLNFLFYDGNVVHNRGIDFFSIPKSFLNLLEDRSMYDTWGGTPYGPYATWYLAHPAFCVFVASWFSFFKPITSYWLFTLFSLGLFFYSAKLIAANTNSKRNKNLVYFIMLCAMPVYCVLYTGNMHAPLVLALTFVFVSIFILAFSENENEIKLAKNKLAFGLLISFFTKPIVILFLPVLLLTKETRKTTLLCIFIYFVVSVAFIVVPIFNPESIGTSKIFNTAFDFNFIKDNLNIFKNNFILNQFMKDNSIHWFNLIAQSDYKLMHIDIYSFPVFIDTLFGRSISPFIFKFPIYFSLALSLVVPFIKEKKMRFETTIVLLFVISLTFFLSYNTVWEYQYSSLLPMVAFFPLLKEKKVFYSTYLRTMFVLGLCFCIPTLYCFFSNTTDFNNNVVLTLIRINKVLPALILFFVLSGIIIMGIKKSRYK